jgi:hypothetical protein
MQASYYEFVPSRPAYDFFGRNNSFNSEKVACASNAHFSH